MMNSTDHVILLVEDYDADAFFVQRAFQNARIKNPVVGIKNGADAIAYLKGQGIYANRDLYPLPIFVLLDLISPGISGFDVLKWIRRQTSLSKLPVIIVTASNNEADRTRSFELGA